MRVYVTLCPVAKCSANFLIFSHFPHQAESQESSSDSPSLSSNSFISAMSSHEDITLVNLHMQVNKPIIDSPLLMASYVTHLAQVRCTNWCSCCLPFGADAFSTPLFQQTEDGGLVYIGKSRDRIGEYVKCQTKPSIL